MTIRNHPKVVMKQQLAYYAGPTTSQVTVYAFLTLDKGVETPAMAPFKATREAIHARFGGQILEGTSEQVEAHELDAQGRRLRVPTGWGVLSF
jgi:hypothetical protein